MRWFRVFFCSFFTGALLLGSIQPAFAQKPTYEPLRRTLLNGFQFKAGQKRIPVAFFDADSTLRISKSGSVSANSATDVQILPRVSNAIAKLNEWGYLVAIVSNQGGIEAGVVTLETADRALIYTAALIRSMNPRARVHYFDFAEDRSTISVEGTEYPIRKPGIGMAMLLEAKLKQAFGPEVEIDRRRSFMVGDSAYKMKDGKKWHFSDSDLGFARNFFDQNFSVGTQFDPQNNDTFYEPVHFFGWGEIENERGAPVFDSSNAKTLEHPMWVKEHWETMRKLLDPPLVDQKK